MKKSALQQILAWTKRQDPWVSDAARRVVQSTELSPEDVTAVLNLCRRHHGLRVPETADSLQPIPLEERHLPSGTGSASTTHLLGISNPAGVNALHPDANLVFEAAGLTIIYGDNGSGKSGYARILKRACRARDRGTTIVPDIYASGSPASASASLPFERDGVGGVVEWQDAENAPASELSAVCVFDKDCASVHVETPNEVAFRPLGLDVPDRLARLFADVASELSKQKAALAQARAGIWLTPTWQAQTVVGQALGRISADTDANSIKRIAELTDVKRERLAQLKRDLADDPASAASQLRVVEQSAATLLKRLAMAVGGTSDESLNALLDAVRTAAATREAAAAASAAQFRAEPLPGVGEAAWRELWKSARAYSENAAYHGQAFPVTDEDARCVLCQQVLDSDAAGRLRRFDEFVRNDVEVRARDAERHRDAMAGSLRKLDLRTRSVRVPLQAVGLYSGSVADAVRRCIINARLRRRAALRGMVGEVAAPVAGPPDAVKRVEDLIGSVRSRIEELEASSSDEARQRLIAERDDLADRQLLGGMMPVVEAEIKRLRSLRAVERCLKALSTDPITRLGSSLARGILTDQLRDSFAKELNRLTDGRIRAELVYAGGNRGQPRYQVQLVARPSSKVASILSEGEQTCVAIAGFLTELATSSHRSTIVFDDPVTSLDHRWRRSVANRLVEVAQERPVVVFTHDIVFVHDLKDRADEEGTGCSTQTVRRIVERTGLIADGLPWIAKSVEHRLDELEKRARASKKKYESGDDEVYGAEARSVYDDLRATWERAIETVAFNRVIVRHRDYVDTKQFNKAIVLNASDSETIRVNHGRCSDVVRGHDPSSGRNAPVPTPSQMLDDIKALRDWVDDLRERQRPFRG